MFEYHVSKVNSGYNYNHCLKGLLFYVYFIISFSFNITGLYHMFCEGL